MKKTLIMAVVATAALFVGLQNVHARMGDGGGGMMDGGMDGGMGGGMMDGGMGCMDADNDGSLSEDEKKAMEKFQADTKELRRLMVVKKAEMHAINSQTNPDEKKAGALAGELFDLKEQIAAKAKAAGVKMGKKGYGMMGGTGPHGAGPHPAAKAAAKAAAAKAATDKTK